MDKFDEKQKQRLAQLAVNRRRKEWDATQSGLKASNAPPLATPAELFFMEDEAIYKVILQGFCLQYHLGPDERCLLARRVLTEIDMSRTFQLKTKYQKRMEKSDADVRKVWHASLSRKRPLPHFAISTLHFALCTLHFANWTRL
eukprot:710799-Pyramimonas_sp.AAC.1